MKAQLQKDEQAHEIEEKRLAQQKAQHDKHLAEIAKHLSVLSAEEQGVLTGSSRDDDEMMTMTMVMVKMMLGRMQVKEDEEEDAEEKLRKKRKKQR